MIVRNRINTALTIAAEGVGAGCHEDCGAVPNRYLACPLCDASGRTAARNPRVRKAIENGDQDPEGRTRSGLRAAGSSERGVVATNESGFGLIEESGNLFRDLDDPNAQPKQAKAILAAWIIAVLDDCGLPVRKAATLTRFAAAAGRLGIAEQVEIAQSDVQRVSGTCPMPANGATCVIGRDAVKPLEHRLHGGQKKLCQECSAKFLGITHLT